MLRLDRVLQVHDRLSRIQAFRAAVGAVHDPVAAVEAHRVVHPREALGRVLVPAVRDPAIPGGSVRGERANFTRLVLGCIEADFCK